MSNAAAAFREALAFHEQGRWSEAESHYRVAALAGHAQSAVNLAVLLLQRGKLDEALGLAVQAVALAPASAEAHATRATALAAVGRALEAIAAYEDALTLEAPPVEAHYGLGCTLQSLGRLVEARACYRRALTLDADYAEAECRLGEVLAQLGRPRESIAALCRALAIDPTYEEARRGLARVLRADGRLQEAEAECRLLVANSAERGLALAELAATLDARGRHLEAIEALRQAVAVNPQHAEVHRRLALALAEAGDRAGAVRSLESAIALEPKPAYLRELTNLRSTVAGDPHLQQLIALEARADSLETRDRIQLHFALGRALTDSGAPQEGFRHLLRGNALHRSHIRYDEVGTLRLFSRVRAIFTPRMLRALSERGPRREPAPIFIVGLPGCGSTVVGQILARHPEVHGGGESPAFGEAVRALGSDVEYPELVRQISSSELERVADSYLSAIGRGAPPGGRTMDGMLANGIFLGLIHAALPNARILYVHRDPLETCLSCFRELFTPDQPFSYDLGELGRFYHAHEALMAHWQQVLPTSVLLRVSYEELAAEFDAVMRRVLTHCGLGWDERVREFHLAPRHATWRPDETTLAPLLRGLAGES